MTTSANNIYAMGDIVDKTAPALTLRHSLKQTT
ncbi:hypothetical protein [Leuconostoc mesenteroides]